MKIENNKNKNKIACCEQKATIHQLAIRNFTLPHGCMLSAEYCRKNVSNDRLFQNYRKSLRW